MNYYISWWESKLKSDSLVVAANTFGGENETYA